MKQQFNQLGYHLERALFTKEECREILKSVKSTEYGYPLVWEKGSAASMANWAAIARHDRLVDIVSELCGENVILWGASLIVRVPNQVHQWHDDMESINGDGFVSIWMGLEKTDRDTSLKLVPGSHQFNTLLFDLADENGVPRQDIEDETVLEWSKQFQPETEVLNLDTTDGDALFFDGRLWHGSKNRSSNKKRKALLLQYARPDKKIRIPKFWHQRWPLEFFTEPKPPCLVVRGSSKDDLNHMVSGPHAAPIIQKMTITNLIEPIDVRDDEPGDQKFKVFELIRGPSTDLRLMECHYSVLGPGETPHLPHIHDEEEIQMMITGTADMIVEDAKGPGKLVRSPVKPGDFVYHPANWRHTYENTSDEPIVCIIFKWITDEYHSDETLKSTLVLGSESLAQDKKPRYGMEFTDLLKGKTGYLRTLKSHMTILQPGHGYDPHIDAYDVGIIQLEGQVEVLGETVQAPAFIYHGAGQKHGMKNTGNVPAKHFAFEFHGKHGDIYEDPKLRRKRRLKQSFSNPAIIFNHLKWRIGQKFKRGGQIWPEDK